ncbi:MAG: hypothetical protein ABI583_13335 [Betaproteobacteria bacterium]
MTWQDVACASSNDDLQSPPIGRPLRRAEGVITDASRYASIKDNTRLELELGSLDLHVLNNRRWGKPQRIKRSREPRAWHEYWDDETGPNAGTQLHFINGRLAGAEGGDPTSSAGATMTEVLAKRQLRSNVGTREAIAIRLR